MNRNSLDIARHAARVRRYERKLKIRAETYTEKRFQAEMLASQARAIQNVGCGGLGYGGIANVSPFYGILGR